jgi:hypothetical protein
MTSISFRYSQPLARGCEHAQIRAAKYAESCQCANRRIPGILEFRNTRAREGKDRASAVQDWLWRSNRVTVMTLWLTAIAQTFALKALLHPGVTVAERAVVLRLIVLAAGIGVFGRSDAAADDRQQQRLPRTSAMDSQKSHNVVFWPICRTSTFIKPPSATGKRRASSPAAHSLPS